MNWLELQGDTSTGTEGLEKKKMVFNSVVSTPEAIFMTIDISNMYLNTHKGLFLVKTAINVLATKIQMARKNIQI